MTLPLSFAAKMATAVCALMFSANIGLAEGSGPYLAARQASFDTNFQAAATYFEQALAQDQANPNLMEAVLAAHMSLGDLPRAVEIADQMITDGHRSQIAFMARMASAGQAEDFDRLLMQLDAGELVGPLVDGLARGWAILGQGDMNGALAAFDAIAKQEDFTAFVLYHKALALASAGAFEGAFVFFDGEDAISPGTRSGVIAQAQILSQLDRNQEAIDLIDRAFVVPLDLEVSALRAQLEEGIRVPFDVITSPSDGLAEIYYMIARALDRSASEDYTLLFTRTAEFLRADHTEAALLSASLLEELGEYALAIDAFASVPVDHPSHHLAAIGQAEALQENGQTDKSIAVLRELVKTHGDLAIVHSTLGDFMRSQKRYNEALDAYDDAIAIYGRPQKGHEFIYFARGVVHESLGNWPKAEADFRQSLALDTAQPQVLNYLGYSLVEQKIKLDEALKMIERAVAIRPESGYIVDSLGWALFRLGRYDEAVPHMERAAELMAIDPIVNDHLGDVYWAVGRKLEARFQWKRALSFIEFDELENAQPDRIRRKLEVGLDQVLKEEGAQPLRIVVTQ